MSSRYLSLAALACAVLALTGCPKGNQDFKAAKQAEALQDYDTALVHYERALKTDPFNTEYKLKATRIRLEAGLAHVRAGQKLRDKGDLQQALAEFQKALAIDPASAIAEQEIGKTLEMIAARKAAAEAPPAPPREEPKLMEKPPELMPLSRAPINLKMTNDARIVFETVAKLAGLTVIFDPDFAARRITTEISNVTLEQALDIVALQSKAFWKPVTSNIIFVVPEQPQKRRDYEEQIVRTFYLSNTLLPQDLTEIVTRPGATATALSNDSFTKLIQNPEIRVVDGQSAKLRVGDRVPVATGSFQAGVGVGAIGGGGAGVVNPLVNTQFQYIDVGVNVDITPHIHPNHQISMKVSVEVSSVTDRIDIGGIKQPVISQRKIEHDVRLEEGEVNILGGLIDRTETRTLAGWPGVSRIPLLRYLFSEETVERQENEVLIILIPRLVRLPQITEANLRGLSAGTETNPSVRRELEPVTPSTPPAPKPQASAQGAAAPTPTSAPVAGAPGGATTPAPETARPSKLRFEPQDVTLKPGETTTIAVVVEDVRDLFSIPMLLQYNPAVISVEEVRHGGFLSGGTQEIAIVQRVDKERGQAIISATRQPNTPGVNGTGTLVGIVIRGVAPGTSSLAVLQVNGRDSQQKPIPLVSGQANIRVQ